VALRTTREDDGGGARLVKEGTAGERRSARRAASEVRGGARRARRERAERERRWLPWLVMIQVFSAARSRVMVV
jgi:hypothetical protein